MFSMYSPNMLKTFQQCPRKFYYRYVKNVSMPVNDSIFEFGKNIHALASYYLKKENIDKMELSLNERDMSVWKYLKSIKYFSYDVVNTEYNLAFKFNDSFLGGRIDALMKDGDNFYILDYKTGTIPKNPKYDYQTMVYVLAVNKFFNTNKVHFIYIDLKNKEEVKITYTDELAEEYKNKLFCILDKIKNVDIYDKKRNCTCEYSSVCF